MIPPEDPIEEYLRAASALLDLPIRPEHYDDVLAALRVLRAQSELITGFDLPPHTDAAPRFTP